MRYSQSRIKCSIIFILSSTSILISLTLMRLLIPALKTHPVAIGGPLNIESAVHVSLSDDLHAKQESFNKDLPLKIDQFTTLQRIDFKRGYWNFHFLVSYYITKVKEFEEKKHASTMSNLCMDKSFVQSLKDSGPFLYQYLDPSGQTADVMISRDDCGE